LMLLRKQLGHKFRHHSAHVQILFKIECAEPVLIPTSSAISRTVKQRSSRIRERIYSMTFAFRLVDSLPERWSLSSKVRPSLKRLTHSLICVAPIASSPEAC
jgi:hypothetical protein